MANSGAVEWAQRMTIINTIY